MAPDPTTDPIPTTDPTPTTTPEPAPEGPDVAPGELPTATAPITEKPKQTAINTTKVANNQPGGKTGGKTIATPPADVTPITTGEGVPDDAPTDDTPDPTGQEVPTGTVKKAEIGETGVSPEDIPTAFNDEQITVIESMSILQSLEKGFLLSQHRNLLMT